jgi:outer membrane lipoprotein-sorting protein
MEDVMMTKGMALLFCAAMVFQTSPAFAQSGDEILAKVEHAMNAPKDRTAVVSMTITSKDGTVKKRGMKILQKGTDKKLFVFLSPADVKGVGFLVIDDDTMYLHTPAFGKIRRIASHVKNENFMGTDFSYNDMSESKYPEKYSAEISSSEGDRYVLTCTPRAGVKTDYSKLVMEVDKQTFIPMSVKMYNKSNKLFKVMTNTKVESIDGYPTPKHIEMKDVLRDHTTVMNLDTGEHDTGLTKKTFSKRKLKKIH